MKNFDLMICSLGNGLTVCNRAVKEHGDYKTVAHISTAGNIKWYVNPGTVPGDALLRIEHHAHAMEANFMAQFDAMPERNQYEYLLDRAPLAVMLEVCGKKSETLSQKVAFLRATLLPTL